MLKNICLSLSTLCQANCVYCPQNRGANLKVKNMPIKLVKKICDEAAHLNIKWMQLSENGDALMNPNFIKILRLLKEKLPGAKKMLYTNFSLLHKNKAEIILREELIDAISCSIDSVDKDTFNKINDLNFENVMKNLKDFISSRDELHSPVGVLVRALTLYSYVHSIKDGLGFYPSNTPQAIPLHDEDVDIKVEMEKFLDLNKDGITNSFIFGWNERWRFANLKGYTTPVICPMLARNETDAFIAPDGSWYSCCLDHKCEIVFGNVNKESLHSIFNSRKRLDFLDKLRNQKYFEIGGACKTVICCLNVR